MSTREQTATLEETRVRAAKVANTPVRRRALIGGGALAVLMVALGHAASDALHTILSALLPTIQARFGLTETVLALLVATLSFGSSVTQPLLGALSDFVSRRLVATLGIILSSALLSLVGVVPTVWLLFGLLFVGGLGSAALHPAGTSISRMAGGKNKTLAVSVFSAGGMLGYAIGPVAILWVVSSFGLGATPWLMIPGLAFGAIIYLLVPPEEPASGAAHHGHRFDAQLFAGPVGLLSLSGILSSIPFVTFTSAVPLWLVEEGGVAPDSTLIGWTLAAFSFSAGIGSIAMGAMGDHVSRRLLIPGTMLGATVPLVAMLFLEVGTVPFFAAAIFAGALVYANLPLMVVSAQDLAPGAMSTASGMLMGFSTGVGGILYVGVGWLQEAIGLAPAMGLSYLLMIPAAVLAFRVLSRHRASLDG